MPESSIGAQLAALRRQQVHVCAVCGEPFVGITLARYCSNRCRQAAKHERARAARAPRT